MTNLRSSDASKWTLRFLLLVCALASGVAPVAAEEVVTSAFRATMPPEWKLIRGGATSTLLEELRRPDCEFSGKLFETGAAFLSIHWSANESFDYDSPNWGPTTPQAAFTYAVSEWAEKARTKELTAVEIRELPATLPIVKSTMVRGFMPHLKRQATYFAALREEGVVVVEMLSSEASKEPPPILDYLVRRISLPASDQALPPCKFKGKGGPALWRTWKSAPQPSR